MQNEEIDITLKIEDRNYPMRVLRSDEERIRKIGKYLNEQLAEYKKETGTTDKVDLATFVAFDSLNVRLHFEDEVNTKLSTLKQKLLDLDKRITSYTS